MNHGLFLKKGIRVRLKKGKRPLMLLAAATAGVGSFAGMCITTANADQLMETKKSDYYICGIDLSEQQSSATGDEETEQEDSEIKTGDTVELQILTTSDLHGKFMPYDYALNQESLSGSCTQISSAVEELRTSNTLVIDGGDIIQDNSSEIFLNDDLHPMMLSMNEINYDVWVTGNHEYDYGTDVLQRLIKQNNAPLLCGNVYDQDGNPLGDDYAIIEKGGIKIGIIGMVTPNISRWSATQLTGWTVTDPVEETKAAIEAIKDKVDVLIAVDHMHIDNELDVPNSGVEDLANACPELDLIIAAHGHKAIKDKVINGVPIIENKKAGATLGRILMEVEKTENGWKIADTTTDLLDMSTYSPQEELTEKLQPYHETAIANAETVIGKFESDYLAKPNEIAEIPTALIEDTPLIDLINEVQLHYSDADVTATALSVENANLYRGDIHKCDMALIYKYGNTLYKIQMTGKQLKKWMEWTAAYYNTYKEGDLTISFNPNMENYNYYMFDGVNYEINIAKEAGSRIENLTWPDGRAVKEDDTFTIAVNNYCASSQLTTYGTVFQEGDDLPTVLEIDVHGEIGGIREMIADYIVNVKHGTLTANTNNNWKITGNNWDEELHRKAVQELAEGQISLTSGENNKPESLTEADLK